jgi:DNA-binding CsgD family transcriptional regulator
METAGTILDDVRHATLLVDESRVILFANDRARHLMESGRGLQDTNGVLTCHSALSNAQLTECIRHPDPGYKEPAGRRVVRVQAPCKQLILLVTAVHPEAALEPLGPAARAVVQVHDPAAPVPVPDVDLIAKCFSLTPTEARVALRIVEGLTAKEIARENRTALATVRSQVRNVLRKMDADRQADLIRMVLALPNSSNWR